MGSLKIGSDLRNKEKMPLEREESMRAMPSIPAVTTSLMDEPMYESGGHAVTSELERPAMPPAAALGR
ncbi:hypothetical protein L7F22_016195, partial [Adiantum nelumboides]|nr:hypothetical protein [Adiantum nelumboides]